jgi:hypothetical protein
MRHVIFVLVLHSFCGLAISPLFGVLYLLRVATFSTLFWVMISFTVDSLRIIILGCFPAGCYSGGSLTDDEMINVCRVVALSGAMVALMVSLAR